MNLLLRGGKIGAVLALILTLGAQIRPATAQASFADPAFQRVWERTDKAVADGKANRSWYWGPTPGFSVQEPNKDAPGGQRLVQYFDKARMEINDPHGKKDDPFYVTNGLLVVELMSGQMQVGNNDFQQRCSADIPLASDGDDAAAPTYTTFGKLLAAPKVNLVGQKALATVDKAGNIGVDSNKAGVVDTDLVYQDPSTGRNVPKVFWDFLNQSGTIYTDGQYTTGKLNDPWFIASGLPVTEAYWAHVKVAGKVTDVLVQAFERRVLTYLPDLNGTPFNVQMGNVGQHYYGWRYKNEGCAGNPVPATPGAGTTPTPGAAACDDSDVPPAKDATIQPRCGAIGTVFQIHITGFTANEKISFWITLPNSRVFGTPRPLDAGHHPGEIDDVFDSSFIDLLGPGYDGIWALTYEGEQSHHQAIAWFKVLPKPPASPTPTGPTATPVPLPPCDLTGTKNGAASPTSGAQGTIFTITITGFQSGEQASYWLTDPDGAVFGSPQTLTIPQDGRGTLRLNSGALYPGRWALTVHGLRSNNEAIVYFCVGP